MNFSLRLLTLPSPRSRRRGIRFATVRGFNAQRLALGNSLPLSEERDALRGIFTRETELAEEAERIQQEESNRDSGSGFVGAWLALRWQLLVCKPLLILVPVLFVDSLVFAGFVFVVPAVLAVGRIFGICEHIAVILERDGKLGK